MRQEEGSDRWEPQTSGSNIFAQLTEQPQSKPTHLNEISFEEPQEVQYPDWFTQGDGLDPLEKGILVNLINKNDEGFLKFAQGLDLVSPNSKALSLQLVRIFCRDRMGSIMKDFSQREMEYIESHQKNRASVIFSALLRFQKLGNSEQLVATLRKHLDSIFKVSDLSYTQIARKISEEANVFKIKLFSDDKKDEEKKMGDTLLAKNPNIQDQIRQMTNTFHYSDTSFTLPLEDSERYKGLLTRDFDGKEIERIMQLLHVGDPFVIKELDVNSLTQEAVGRLRYPRY